jgi:hypothetical protein
MQARWPRSWARSRSRTASWTFTVGGKSWQCDFAGAGHCVAAAEREPGVRSPDGRHEAFVRDWNLWLRDADGGHEVQLTTNGIKDYGYATDNAGWKHTGNAIWCGRRTRRRSPRSARTSARPAR